jgi:hypothetical protein
MVENVLPKPSSVKVRKYYLFGISETSDMDFLSISN